MMTFSTFRNLTDLMVKNRIDIQKAHKLGIDLYEICESQHVLINALWSNILTDNGLDWFNWFLYEKDYISNGIGRKDITANDGDIQICKNLKGVYDYLVKNNYFKI